MDSEDWGCLGLLSVVVIAFIWASGIGYDFAYQEIAQDYCEAQGYTETSEIDDKYYCIDQFGELPTIDAFATMGIVE